MSKLEKRQALKTLLLDASSRIELEGVWYFLEYAPQANLDNNADEKCSSSKMNMYKPSSLQRFELKHHVMSCQHLNN